MAIMLTRTSGEHWRDDPSSDGLPRDCGVDI